MKIVAFFHMKEVRWNLADEDCRRLEARFPGVHLVAIEDPADLSREIVDADVFVGFTIPRDVFVAARQLRWVQSISAGIEENLYPEMLASSVVLTGGTGLHAVCIPEHVLGQMFVLARNFHEAQRLQAACEWNRFQCIIFGPSIIELQGSNLAIFGAGAIGQGLAQRAAALGMHVRVLRRHATRPLPGVEAVVPPERLQELLSWADFVVLALPLTRETHGLVGERQLAAMKSSAHLINVGRGELIDEEALVSALQRGAIGGAALDVFNQEPLPSEHPFWKLPNLVLTPHISGYTPNYFRKALDLFEDNLGRYIAATPLRNVVDKRLGYAPPSDAK
ncbi:MAG: D-2-hydroxyacid dehydrogenase [Deltaproteobacteria bacterium]|nr:D-2-hydroxyacid dehydrogenase [Deltaproteobacteria bacterium]